MTYCCVSTTGFSMSHDVSLQYSRVGYPSSLGKDADKQSKSVCKIATSFKYEFADRSRQEIPMKNAGNTNFN